MSGGNEALNGMSADAGMAAAYCQPTWCTLTARRRSSESLRCRPWPRWAKKRASRARGGGLQPLVNLPTVRSLSVTTFYWGVGFGQLLIRRPFLGNLLHKLFSGDQSLLD